MTRPSRDPANDHRSHLDLHREWPLPNPSRRRRTRPHHACALPVDGVCTAPPILLVQVPPAFLVLPAASPRSTLLYTYYIRFDYYLPVPLVPLPPPPYRAPRSARQHPATSWSSCHRCPSSTARTVSIESAPRSRSSLVRPTASRTLAGLSRGATPTPTPTPPRHHDRCSVCGGRRESPGAPGFFRARAPRAPRGAGHALPPQRHGF